MDKIKEKMLTTFKNLKQVDLNKKKSSQNLYFNNSNQTALCVKVSRSYPADDHKQKYWYTLTEYGKGFLEKFKKSYIFLGCRDNKTKAYLIPFFENKKHFLNCDKTQTGWQIRISHKLVWYFSTYPDINLYNFEISLCD